MKKIVALVLALVLALSLATVAFAKTVHVGDAKEATSTTYVEGVAYNKTAGYGFAPYYMIDTNICKIVPNAADADYTIDGKIFVDIVDNIEYLKYTKEVTSFTSAKYPTCTDDAYDQNADLCVDSKGNVYSYAKDWAVGATACALLDGKYTVYITAVDPETVMDASHVLLLDAVASTAADKNIYKCALCGKYFRASDTQDTAKNATGDMDYDTQYDFDAARTVLSANQGWAKLTAKETDNFTATGASIDGDYIWEVDAKGAAVTSTAATTTTGVSSAKTFDAGVALYAGMALMSVAGSAVVIGKKKEF